MEASVNPGAFFMLTCPKIGYRMVPDDEVIMDFKRLPSDQQERLLGYAPADIPRGVAKRAQEGYAKFGLDKATDATPDTILPLPSWLGNWRSHVDEAVEMYGSKYLADLEAMAKLKPELPGEFTSVTLPGWHVWTGTRWIKSSAPKTDACIADFETVELGGYWYPSCLAMLTVTGEWYLWLADLYAGKWLQTGNAGATWVNTLQRTLSDLPKGCTYINHNVPYDRAYDYNEYYREDSGNRYFDTMSAFIACRGLSNQQRIAYKAMAEDDHPAQWVDETSTNGLDAVYEFYYPGKPKPDKRFRDEMVKGGLAFHKANRGDIIRYCLEDVMATFEVYQAVYGELKLYQPDKASWVGQMMLGSVWLPLSADRFPGYYDRCENAYQASLKRIQSALVTLATGVAFSGQPEGDPWLSQLDWKPGRLELKPYIRDLLKSIWGEDFGEFACNIVSAKTKGSNKRYLIAPKWYREYIKDPSLKKADVPLLLKVTYLGKPVIWQQTEAGEGWNTEDGPIPHPEKKGKRVTSLFMKGFSSLWDNGALSASLDGTAELVQLLTSTINWVSFRKRAAGIHTEAPEGFPVVLPQISVTGTITRRAADNVFQVLANPKKTRIGTEFKSMIEAPPGYVLVGADVQAQEAWICGIFGDTEAGYCGSSPFGYMNIVGTRETRTDVHTLFADLLGMERDPVKPLNFGVIYGLGEKGAIDTILKACPHFPLAEATAKGKQHIALFKGTRSQYTNRWTGGLASDSFNFMEALAKSREARTPVCDALLSAALRTANRGYMTTKINWGIQSSGVDFRDLLVLLTRYFFDKLGVRGKLLMTIHDEIRTLVVEEDAIKATYALQLAHLLVRCAFIDRLNLDCLPLGICYFPAVDVDKVLRKEPDQPCVTPTQPEAIAPGYTLSPTELLNSIYEHVDMS